MGSARLVYITGLPPAKLVAHFSSLSLAFTFCISLASFSSSSGPLLAALPFLFTRAVSP